MDYRVMFLMFFILQTVSCTKHWSMFTFTQSWSPTLCKFAGAQGKSCKIPNEVNTWQIHGLWPGYGRNNSPRNCNISSPFDYNKIKVLEPMLKKYWSNCFPDTEKSSFWKHEWETHGRCATVVKATSTESLYFKKVLQMRERYPIEKFLSDKRITPNKNYNVSQIHNAVMEKTKHKPTICCGSLQSGAVWLSQIQICFNKKFEIIDCVKSAMQMTPAGDTERKHTSLPPQEPCGNHQVFYAPLKRN